MGEIELIEDKADIPLRKAEDNVLKHQHKSNGQASYPKTNPTTRQIIRLTSEESGVALDEDNLYDHERVIDELRSVIGSLS